MRVCIEIAIMQRIILKLITVNVINKKSIKFYNKRKDKFLI
jgi:hypothetical protein